MKRWIGVVVALAVAAAIAVAGPKPAPKLVTGPTVAGQPTPEEKKQLDELGIQLVQLQAKQASLPALKT